MGFGCGARRRRLIADDGDRPVLDGSIMVSTRPFRIGAVSDEIAEANDLLAPRARAESRHASNALPGWHGCRQRTTASRQLFLHLDHRRPRFAHDLMDIKQLAGLAGAIVAEDGYGRGARRAYPSWPGTPVPKDGVASARPMSRPSTSFLAARLQRAGCPAQGRARRENDVVDLSAAAIHVCEALPVPEH